MGRAIPVYSDKNILKVPLRLSFLNLNYEKSAKYNPTFQWDNFFSILPKYWQISKYTVILSKFSFPKKGKELSISFRW